MGNEVGTTTSLGGYMETKGVREARAFASELCRHMYTLGWFSGTAGSITIKVHDDSIPKPRQLILISPSGTSLSFSLSLSSYGISAIKTHIKSQPALYMQV